MGHRTARHLAVSAAFVFGAAAALPGNCGWRENSPAAVFGAMLEGEKAAAEGNYAPAMERFSLVLGEARKWGSHRLESHCLRRLGDMAWNRGRMADSRAGYEEAAGVARARELTAAAGDLEALLEIHRLYAEGKALRDDRSDYPGSISRFEEAVRLARRIGSPDHESKCLRQLSANHYYLGDYGRFHETSRAAGAIAEARNNRREMSYCRNNIGLYYYKTYDYSASLGHLSVAVRLAEGEDDKTLLSEAITNIAAVYYDVGETEKALEYLRKALSLDLEIGHEAYRVVDLNNLGNAYKSLKMSGDSIAVFMEALLIAWRGGDRGLESTILNNLGDALSSAGHHDLSLKAFRMAFRQAGLAKNRPMLSLSLNNIADGLRLKGDHAAAVDHYIRALASLEAGFEAKILWDVHHGMGRCLAELGDDGKAGEHFRQAIEVIEKVRDSIEDDALKISFNRNKFPVYEDYLRLLLRRPAGRSGEDAFADVFAHVEQAKSRIFLEGLADSRAVSRKAEGPAAGSGTAAALAVPETVRLPELRRDVLKDDTAIVEYFLGDATSVALTMTGRTARIDEIPGKNRIEDSLRAFIKFIGQKKARPSEGLAAGRRIMDEIRFPADILERENIGKLVIVPDGILHFLPFETLAWGGGGEILLDRFQISYAPSSSALARLAGRRSEIAKEKGLLAVGNPVFSEKGGREESRNDGWPAESVKGEIRNSLPFSKDEIALAMSMFPAGERTVLEGFEANEANLKKLEKRRYQVIHFACHARLDGDVPLRSVLVLSGVSESEDDLLQIKEIRDMRLAAHLVVLSACQTGRGRLEQGEGVMGLPRIFFFNGSSSVLSTLWRIEDKPTSVFIGKYFGRLSQGLSKAEALRRAKLDMRGSRYENPYFWAGFILSGEGESPVSFR